MAKVAVFEIDIPEILRAAILAKIWVNEKNGIYVHSYYFLGFVQLRLSKCVSAETGSDVGGVIKGLKDSMIVEKEGRFQGSLQCDKSLIYRKLKKSAEAYNRPQNLKG